METSSVGKRLKIFRESQEMKQLEFCEKTGIRQQTLSGIETSRSEPSTAVLQQLFTAFPKLNTEWLIMGTGPMLRDGRTLTPVVTEDPTPTPPAAIMAVNRDGETLESWRALANDRLDRIEFLEDLLRHQAGMDRRPEPDTTPATAGAGGKADASADAADNRRAVDELAKELLPQPYRIVATQGIGFALPWVQNDDAA